MIAFLRWLFGWQELTVVREVPVFTCVILGSEEAKVETKACPFCDTVIRDPGKWLLYHHIAYDHLTGLQRREFEQRFFKSCDGPCCEVEVIQFYHDILNGVAK